tara:strand:+ start:360 stop:503 length:144 start_codon:yes stop_codon:yes gene_type:complete
LYLRSETHSSGESHTKFILAKEKVHTVIGVEDDIGVLQKEGIKEEEE